ncbi:3-deoxy-manno-octulosonate cytidylyltransferase [Marinoscillum furvescens]|uniref:3-deoxy-manno-octulosonate cytidylyltransferase n=1 Tax=Marinoscillum furvescens DSM 4134 TaxID=1122208 RepID=A0A3D9L4D6_MARFU|nr:3-deoxy-manno-octulosonate cytidylyltransferase [Marinoscillum furvescens]RED97497.1 3-deoxy-manno-octulosonate cytidylyltransferase (CMP-KDO synthetase) [Marinoscillum furvescens DSM 4134]
MKILGIIPSRMGSKRLPGKPLIPINGKPMIRRVYEQAVQSKLLARVVVATDDHRIADEITHIGGNVLMTSSTHRNGTERCGEVLQTYPEYDYVVNIQGDEPYVHPDQIDLLCDTLDGNVELATLAKKITQEATLHDPSKIKVTFDRTGKALYFSRTCIPYLRDHNSNLLAHHDFYKHIGLYAYRSDILPKINQLPPGKLEQAESLEQLRWMENGYSIQVGITTLDSQMVDTMADVAHLENIYSK